MKNLVMKWKEFIDSLHYSDSDLENITGVSRQVINNIRRGKVIKPQYATQRKLEEGLKLKIQRKGENNINIISISLDSDNGISENSRFNIFDFPVIREPRGEPLKFMEDIVGSVKIAYTKKQNCFALQSWDESMADIIKPGDYMLIDKDAPIQEGSLVYGKIKNSKTFLRYYKQIPTEMIILNAENRQYEDLYITKADLEWIYRVKLIIKQV